ncbi:MAG: protein-glutamate O-methyltransferase CheR [Magnetospirillum sp. WYHS-4]
MDQQKFEFVTKLLKDRSGLVLSVDKAYLIESRLAPIAKKYGHATTDYLIDRLRDGRDEALAHEITDAMTTNETFFFRDGKPFDFFRQTLIPALADSRSQTRSLRVWCAAASTGQEPYTLAMILREELKRLPDWKLEIVATDISTESLARARMGRYSQFEVQRGLPIQLLVKYFKKQDEMWEISPEVRSMVDFRSFNLLMPFASLGRFDVVFCRNVLIYFDIPTKTDILNRMSRQMADDAHLFLGGAETVLGITERFKALSGERGVYQVNGRP